MVEYCCDEWDAVVQEQENALRYSIFGREDALQLGLRIVELAKNKYRRSVAVRIYCEGTPVFLHSMEGCDLRNEWWMHGKLNTAQAYQCSSLRALVDLQKGRLSVPEERQQGNSYLFCGGCWPIRLKDDKVAGYIVVSALKHEEDHQIIVDALQSELGITVSAIG